MVLFNYATKELTAKVVYYGPGLCGKTTNLQYIYDTLPGTAKGKMLSLATKTDRTLFFDFLPIDLGKIRGMKTKIQLYTVPGQVFYDTTRKLVLKGADGVVFVADSQAPMIEANIDSFQNLITNLKEQNIDISEMPHVIQYNKRDMKNVMSIEELESRVNNYSVPYFEAIAPKGTGVFETLKGISKVVLKNLAQKYGLEEEMQDTGGSKFGAKPPPLPSVPGGRNASQPAASAGISRQPKPAATATATANPSRFSQPAPAAASIDPTPVHPAAQNNPKKSPRVESDMEEIQFIEDETGDPLGAAVSETPAPQAPTPPAQRAAPPSRGADLEPIPSLDDSEVIELDDMDPLEIEELDDMAEIATMASESGKVERMATPEPAPAAGVAPIEVPVSINLPMNLAGKPLRLRLDIVFEEE